MVRVIYLSRRGSSSTSAKTPKLAGSRLATSARSSGAAGLEGRKAGREDRAPRNPRSGSAWAADVRK